jgi:FdhD protein
VRHDAHAGDDRELALGFLHAEGVIRSIDDVGSLRTAAAPATKDSATSSEVLPAPGVVLAPESVVGATRHAHHLVVRGMRPSVD